MMLRTINQSCIVLWIILFMVGLWLAMHRPLWNDELCSQKLAIERGSWPEIFTGRIKEINNPPLYYSLQKVVTFLIPLNFPVDILEGLEKSFLYVYPKGQIILRLLPNLLMTTAIVLLVRFFWIRQGLATAVIALLSALSACMVWKYWVEARPYALWFLLTTLQALYLMEILIQGNGLKAVRPKKYLLCCHYLLAFTVTLGVFQIIIAQVILFIVGVRQLRYHWWAGLLPLGIALFYFVVRSWAGLSHTLHIAINPLDVIRLNFSLEQLVMMVFYVMAFLCRKFWIQSGTDGRVWRGLIHLPYLLASLFFSIALLFYIYCHVLKHDLGAPIYERHFLFVSALGVVLVPAMFGDLWSRAQGWWRGIFLLFFIVLLVSQLIEGFANAWFQGYYY